MISPRLVARDKALLQKSGELAYRSIDNLLPDLSVLTQAEAGGALRTVATGVVSNIGKVATVSAATSYNDMAKSVLGDKASYMALPIEVAAKVLGTLDPVIGYGITKFTEGDFEGAASAIAYGASRVVSDLYRETLVKASQEDRNATGYQRVASPTACAFCLVVTLNEYTSFDESGGYHDNCSCTTVPVFKGADVYRPDYYNEFEAIYFQGRADSGSSKAKDILAAIRTATGRA